MNIPRALSTFLVGAALAAAWLVGWPEREPEPAKAGLARHRADRPAAPSPAELASWLGELETASDAATRAEAAENIGRLPASAFPAAFEGVELIRNHSLTLPARALLARWAAVDGEAAVEWAWLSLRTTARWNRAFDEIAAAWAWSRPEDLAEWARQHAEPSSRHSTLPEVEGRDKPPAGSDELRRIARALHKVDLRSAFEVLQLCGGWSSEDSRLIESLQSVDQVREALLAIGRLGEMEPHKFNGYDQFLAGSLLQRWKQIDAEDFANSPYAHLLPDLSAPPELPDLHPAVKRHLEWHREFREWRDEASGAAPDMTGWSTAKREAWADFEALLPDPRPPLSEEFR